MKKIYILLSLIIISIAALAKTELTFWHGIIPQTNITEAVEMFEKKNPDIKINLFYAGNNQDVYEEMIDNAEKEGKRPDLVWWGPQATGKFAKMGKIVKAQDFINSDSEFDKTDIFDGLWEVSKYRGEIWTLPFDANNLALYYNKTLFANAGIDPAGIKNWKDFREASKKLTLDNDGDSKPDQYGFVIPFGDQEWNVWIWETFFWQAGGDFMQNDTKTMLDSAASIKAMRLWHDMAKTDKTAIVSGRNTGYPDSLEALTSGKAAMIINGPWLNNAFKTRKEQDIGVMFLPADMRRATNIGGESLYIFKSTTEKENAAWRFAKFVMSKEFQIHWAKVSGYIPVCRSATEASEYKDFLAENEILKTFVDQMRYGKARPSIPEYPNISAFFGSQLEKAVTGEITPEMAAENIQEYSDTLMKTK